MIDVTVVGDGAVGPSEHAASATETVNSDMTLFMSTLPRAKERRSDGRRFEFRLLETQARDAQRSCADRNKLAEV